VTVEPITKQSTACSRNGISYRTISDIPFKNMALFWGHCEHYSVVYWAWSSQALYGEIQWYAHPL